METDTSKLKQTFFNILYQNELLYDFELIKNVYNFSQKVHQDQKRKSGEDYFNHPLRVAITTASLKMDNSTICASLLHDTVEDCHISYNELLINFGEEITRLVNGVSNLGKIKYLEPKTQDEKLKFKKAENLRKTFLALSKDLRVAIIKLADRLDNVKTLDALPQDKQIKIAQETLEIFAPLAHRLGLFKIARELEDYSFRYQNPEAYKKTEKLFEGEFKNIEKYLKDIVKYIGRELKNNGASFLEIEYRVKTIYSLWKKLERYNGDLSQIHDILALRIITDTVENCYKILGIVHKLFTPLPNSFDDYIARPKPNGYQALHTDVYLKNNQIIEIQIKTKEMHENAENGIAAHWYYQNIRNLKTSPTYKNKGAIKTPPIPKEYLWVKQIKEWQNYFPNSLDFIESLKADYFEDRIFVLTPKGEAIDLPRGSTPIDFAYKIHTDIGNQAVGAKINGKFVTLDQELQSGDVVEILIQKGKKPSPKWLEFAKTNLAKNKIREILEGKNKSLFKIMPRYNKIELTIKVKDRMGLIKDISLVLTKNQINIESINFDKSNLMLKTIIKTANKNELPKIISKISRIKGIETIVYKEKL